MFWEFDRLLFRVQITFESFYLKKMNKTIHSSTREVIFKVYRRCLAEYKAGNILSELDNVYQRTADMTGKSVSTIRRIAAEGQHNNGIFSTPGKHRQGRPRKLLDDLHICAIRRKIHYFYTEKKQVPTLRNLLPLVKKELGFDGSREHLRKVLISLGFKYKKCQSERAAWIERPNVAAKREAYLKIIIDNRNLPVELRKDVIYLDKRYVHYSNKRREACQSIDLSRVKNNISTGKRYIILNAGSETGFVQDALLIFSGTNEDCGTEMNLTKWVEDILIPNLPDASIVVIDNTFVNSKVLNKPPSLVTQLSDIKMWLTENDIPYDVTLKKPQLLMLVKRHKPEPLYEIDHMLNEHGHTVVRLPRYHCDLNPLELIWGIAKNKIASIINLDQESIDIKEVAELALRDISVADWKKSCKHVMKIEREYYESGITLYDDIDALLLNHQDDSINDDTSESESEDDDDIGASPTKSMDVDSEVEYLEDYL